MEAVSPAVERVGIVPVLASRNAPVPNVHLASPGRRQASPSRAACWSTTNPPTFALLPKASVVPTTVSHGAISGSRSPSNPNRPRSSGSQPPVSRSVTSERLAVEASVTNAPVSW
jgi:hypothetical protein